LKENENLKKKEKKKKKKKEREKNIEFGFIYINIFKCYNANVLPGTPTRNYSDGWSK
jgi:hypothetical protein